MREIEGMILAKTGMAATANGQKEEGAKALVRNGSRYPRQLLAGRESSGVQCCSDEDSGAEGYISIRVARR